MHRGRQPREQFRRPGGGHQAHPAWYWARLELAIGVGLVIVAGLILLFTPSFTNGRAQVGWEAAGVLGMVVGLAWMIRIFRSLRDEPPPWRYRRR